MIRTRYKYEYRKRQERKAQGLCTKCGDEPLVETSVFGPHCLRLNRERARARKNYKP